MCLSNSTCITTPRVATCPTCEGKEGEGDEHAGEEGGAILILFFHFISFYFISFYFISCFFGGPVWSSEKVYMMYIGYRLATVWKELILYAHAAVSFRMGMNVKRMAFSCFLFSKKKIHRRTRPARRRPAPLTTKGKTSRSFLAERRQVSSIFLFSLLKSKSSHSLSEFERHS